MNWMKKELMTGFQKLFCLGMDRTPSHELILGTTEAWMEALTHNRTWDQERDTVRIQQAFSTVMRTKKFWPTPAEFMECVPAIVERPALPAQTFTDEERRENISRVYREAMKALGVPVGEITP